MNKVVIYPGRFQPMLSHHAEVYKQLENTFPDAKVYVGTSDKVEGEKSPFNFGEKQQIISTHGIPAERVIRASRPYHKDDYPFDEEDTIIIFAVGEKDTDRFPMNNVDPKTGLDMTVRGEERPKYYQMINTISNNPLPMSDRGYIYIAPSIERDEEVASASVFRQEIQNAPDRESAKQIFDKEFLNYDEAVFDMVYNKIKGSKMNEDLNILKQLAGLNMSEDAPIEFESNADPKNVKFINPPSKSSAEYSIANRFPEGTDPNDPEVKKEQFIQALLKTPENLLGEINERIDPKEPNGEAVGVRLNKIIDNLGDEGISSLDDSDKSFVFELTASALKNMDLVAGDDSPEYEGEPDINKVDLESVNFDDVKEEYGIEEKTHDDDDDDDKESPMDRHKKDLDKYLELLRQRGVEKPNKKHYGDDPQKIKDSVELEEGGRSWDIMMTDAQDSITNCSDEDECIRDLESMKYPNPDNFDDELANDVVDNYIEMIQKDGLRSVQAEIESGMQEPNFESIDEDDGNPKKVAQQGWSRIKDWPAWAKLVGFFGIGTGIAFSFNKLMDVIKDNWPVLSILSVGGLALHTYLRKVGLSDAKAKRLQQEWDLRYKREWIEAQKQDLDLRRKLKQLEKDTGLKVKTQSPEGSPKVSFSWQDFETEPDFLKGKTPYKKESFDPRMEPSREEEAMNHVADGNFGAAAEVLGDNSKDAGDNLMDEWIEHCNEKGLDYKDALNDFHEVENFVDEVVGGMDDKNYPAEMESIDKQIAEYNELRKLSGLSTLEEQLEGIELPEDENEMGTGEKRGRAVGDLVNMGMTVGGAVMLVKNTMTGMVQPQSPMGRALLALIRGTGSPAAALAILLGGQVLGLALAHKIRGWILRVFGGKLGKIFDIGKDDQNLVAQPQA